MKNIERLGRCFDNISKSFMPEKLHKVYLSLGTNLGDKEDNLNEAIKKIGQMVGDVVRQSSFLETEPWGFESDNRFLNACILVLTDLSAHELLEMTQAIEQEMGRKEKSHNGIYHDRMIDIDILLYDDITVDEPDLKIPHPHMKERDFVMKPLMEILPPKIDNGAEQG